MVAKIMYLPDLLGPISGHTWAQYDPANQRIVLSPSFNITAGAYILFN